MSEFDFKRLSRDLAGRDGLAGSAVILAIGTMIVMLLVWASWAKLDNVTRGEGRIISSVQNQIVQASEGGVILRRFVSENSVVAEGETLFEIDPVDASSEFNSLTQRLASLDIKEQRLRAEISGKDLSIAADLDAKSPLVVLTEQNLFAARRARRWGCPSQVQAVPEHLPQLQHHPGPTERLLGSWQAPR